MVFLYERMISMTEDLESGLKKLGDKIPSVMRAFAGLQEAATADGALDAKTKRLIMVGIAAALRCEPCLRLQAQKAVESGANAHEILEAAGVAILMGGGPTAAYSALYLMDELEKTIA